MFIIRDNIGNECEAETVEAAGTAAVQLFADAAESGSPVTMVTILRPGRVSPEWLVEELKRITTEVADQHGLGEPQTEEQRSGYEAAEGGPE